MNGRASAPIPGLERGDFPRGWAVPRFALPSRAEVSLDFIYQSTHWTHLTHTRTHTPICVDFEDHFYNQTKEKKSSGINHLVLQLNCIWNGTSRHTSHDRAGVLWTVRLSHVSGWPRHCVQVTASPGGLGSNLTTDRVLLSLTDRGILVWVQGARTCPGTPRSRQRGHSDTSPLMSHIHVFLVCGPLLLSELLYYHPVYLCPPERGGYTVTLTWR